VIRSLVFHERGPDCSADLLHGHTQASDAVAQNEAILVAQPNGATRLAPPTRGDAGPEPLIRRRIEPAHAGKEHAEKHMGKILMIGSVFALLTSAAMAQAQNPPAQQNPEAVNTTGTNNPAGMAQAQNPPAKQNPEAVHITGANNPGAGMAQDQNPPAAKQNPEAVNTTGADIPGAGMAQDQNPPAKQNPEAVNTTGTSNPGTLEKR
jgi:hypothetical protein